MSEIVYWTMRNGKQISVDNMDTNHLRNVLKLIIKNNQEVQTDADEKKSYWNKQNQKVFLNGDMANEFNDSYPADEEDLDYRFNNNMDLGDSEFY